MTPEGEQVSVQYHADETGFHATGSHVHQAHHTPPEWAYKQWDCPEKWYTTYCQGPLGVPKNVFGQV